MNETETVVLGWIAEGEWKSFNEFEVTFSSEYPYILVKHYIEKGEFRSELPFGIWFNGDVPILVSPGQPTILTVSNNPAKALRERNGASRSNDALGMLAVTAIYKILESIGYSRPMESETFIGRSKGYASERILTAKSEKYRVLDTELNFSIHRAENFEFHVFPESPPIILYDPRHEIHNRKYGISNELIIPKSLIQDPVMKRNISTVMERYSSITREILKPNDFSVTLTELPPYALRQLDRPILLAHHGDVIELSEHPSQKFGDLLLQAVQGAPRDFSIGFAVDDEDFNEMHSNLIKRFIQAFEDWVGESFVRVSIADNEGYEFSGADSFVVVLNNSKPGYSGLHDMVKMHTVKPTKMVTLNNIRDEEWNEIIPRLWLALRFRLKNALFQIPATSIEIPLIGISSASILRGSYQILAAVATKGYQIISKREMFHKHDRSYQIDAAKIEELMSAMSKEMKVSDSLVVFEEDTSLAQVLIEASESIGFTLAVVRPSHSLMLRRQAGEFLKPLDGQYVELDRGRYLLMTNGIPDIADEGIPSPLYIEVKQAHGLNNHEILESIYGHSFCHPASLTKTKLPFALYSSRKAAWLKSSLKRLEWSSEEVNM